jgi:hypothetical protein
MGNDPREWVAVRTSGWWCEEPGLWDTPLRSVSLQPPATPSTVYAWDHRNRLIGVTEFDDEENIHPTSIDAIVLVPARCQALCQRERDWPARVVTRRDSAVPNRSRHTIEGVAGG